MARWIEHLVNGEPHYEEDWDIVFQCDSCGGQVLGNEYKFCPWCGKKIVENDRNKRTPQNDKERKEMNNG